MDDFLAILLVIGIIFLPGIIESWLTSDDRGGGKSSGTSSKSTSTTSNSSITLLENKSSVTSGTHIVGVMFKNQEFGCYYYLGNNDIYNVGDKVIVPAKNGNEEATVVYKKVFSVGEKLPYEKDKLKTVIRKM